MDAPLTETKLMSMEDWLDQFGDEPFEFVDGEKIPMSPSVAGSNYTARILEKALDRVVEAQKLGEVLVEATFVFTDNPQWVRRSLIPDVAFVKLEKLVAFRTRYPNWKELPYMIVPDLVVEVLSPTDRQSDVRRKTARYFEEGVQLVWVVDYLNEVVEVFNKTGFVRELTNTDTLTAGDIIPCFELTLETLFT